MYKSEILFSPVKEVPLVSFSIDSLDCEEHDIMLTCQANKDNYTIAFEGSVLMEKSTENEHVAGHHGDECEYIEYGDGFVERCTRHRLRHLIQLEKIVTFELL